MEEIAAVATERKPDGERAGSEPLSPEESALYDRIKKSLVETKIIVGIAS